MKARTLRLSKWILIAFLCLSACGSMLAQSGNPNYRANRILVKPKAGANLSVLYGARGLTKVKRFPAMGNLQILRVPAGASVQTILAALAQSGLVQYAEPDYLVHTLRTPNDVHFQDGSLWNLHNTGQARGALDADIDAPEAWDTITDASDVIVAVLDTGVRYTHEDLTANMWVNPDEIPGNGVDDDGNVAWVANGNGTCPPVGPQKQKSLPSCA